MKIMFMTLRDRVERFTDFSNLSKDWEYVFAGYEKDTTKLLEMGGDADAILADAITPVPKELIEAISNLKIIHSEGVGYEGITLQRQSKGIFMYVITEVPTRPLLRNRQ